MLSLHNYKHTTVRHFWLYALALERQKYYVGITSRKDPYVRIKQHGGPKGAQWTKKYKPLKPLKLLTLKDIGTMSLYQAEQREQATFEHYRKQYGLRNVRGGRILSTRPVYRIGPFYCNQALLEALGVILLLLLSGIYILSSRS